MNQAFASVFAIIFIISILEVTTFNSKDHDENTHDETFHEFDDDPSYEYSSKVANQDIDHNEKAENDDSIEIRQPTGSKPSSVFKTPINMPLVRFAFWFALL